jgi:hypothetical protein
MHSLYILKKKKSLLAIVGELWHNPHVSGQLFSIQISVPVLPTQNCDQALQFEL